MVEDAAVHEFRCANWRHAVRKRNPVVGESTV